MESQQLELSAGQGERSVGVEGGQETPQAGEEGGDKHCEQGHLHQVEEAGHHPGWLGGEEAEEEHVVGVVQAESGHH